MSQSTAPVVAIVACDRSVVSLTTKIPTNKRKPLMQPQQEKTTKKERALWTSELVESLIHLRF